MFFIVYSLTSITLIICYLASIGLYIYYWKKLAAWNLPKGFSPQTTLTLIIAARNEAGKIKACLDALFAQKYPRNLLQIWIVDDHSDDETSSIITTFIKTYNVPHFHYLKLAKGLQGKKDSIAAAIQHSHGELIVTTDADCVMHPNWLLYLVSFYENYHYKFIAAPVTFFQEKSLFERFQTLDFMGMMAVSAAGIEGRFMNMCNGANLAYERQAFETVNGFEGIDTLSSGDDMLLLQKISSAYPQKIGYLKHCESQTYTHAKSTIKGFVQQRIRWASKSGAYSGWQVGVMLTTVWLLCLSMLFDIFIIPWNIEILYLFGLKFLLKGIADFYFLRMMTRFFERQEMMRYFLPALFFHWWYIAIVGTIGIFSKNYTWKGRVTQ